jgi:hypothetical protein
MGSGVLRADPLQPIAIRLADARVRAILVVLRLILVICIPVFIS